MFGWILLILFAGVLAYIRLAPTDPTRWHKGTGKNDLTEKQGKGSYVWRAQVEGDGTEMLQKIDSIAMNTPRTTRLAGSVDEGQITYITRSQVIGFPDYTTVRLFGENPQNIEIYGRLRFGRSDFGVNANRIKQWRAAI